MTELKISYKDDSSSSINISSSQQSNRLPQAGEISVYKSTRGGDFLCLHGYTYQIDRRMKNKIKWKCKESRNKTRCGSKIYTTENVGTDRISAYKYLGSNDVFHSHDGDNDQNKVAIFQSQVKDTGTNNRTVPPSRIINQLATSMKLTDKQLGMIPLHATLCYNAVLQRRAQQSHLSIWTLIELLITEETAVRMKHFQSLSGKTKPINKTIRNGVININQQINLLNQKLEVNDIELDDCLISLSTLVGVKYDQWHKQRKKDGRADDSDDQTRTSL
ncbi:unnamed protein product [Rotaria sp. Silwood2]|nr:unnamed protein product [Rotaria sp. Silwood2]